MARAPKKTIQQQIVGVATIGLPGPARAVLGGRLASSAIVLCLPLLVGLGFVHITWQNGIPHFTFNRERAAELRAKAAVEVEQLRAEYPAAANIAAQVAARHWPAADGQGIPHSGPWQTGQISGQWPHIGGAQSTSDQRFSVPPPQGFTPSWGPTSSNHAGGFVPSAGGASAAAPGWPAPPGGNYQSAPAAASQGPVPAAYQGAPAQAYPSLQGGANTPWPPQQPSPNRYGSAEIAR